MQATAVKIRPIEVVNALAELGLTTEILVDAIRREKLFAIIVLRMTRQMLPAFMLGQELCVL
jgi:hypothetical protein